MTTFPNGTVCVAAHYRHHVESWPGGFHRNAEQDAALLRENPLPPENLALDSFHVSGRTIDRFHGARLVAMRPGRDPEGRIVLAAFAGSQCREIQWDGQTHSFAEVPMPFIAWAPVAAARRMPRGAILEIWVHGNGRVRIPLVEKPRVPELALKGSRPGTAAANVAFEIREDALEFNATWPRGMASLVLLDRGA